MKPKWIASNVASDALMTEAQPLIPQAQGISRSALSARSLRAIGNGIPIQVAKGAIRKTDINIRMVRFRSAAKTKR